jgi:hypothetical protein
MRDEVEIFDYYEAGLFQYVGTQCIKCHITGTDTIWTFRVKAFDAVATKEDFSKEDTSVHLLAYIKALNSVASFRNQARRSLEQTWRSPRYAEAA